MSDLIHQPLVARLNHPAEPSKRRISPVFLAVLLFAAAAIGATLGMRYKDGALEAAAKQRTAETEAEIQRRTNVQIAKVFADKRLLRILCAR